MLFRKSLQVGGCESPENTLCFKSVLSSVANQEAWNAFESDGLWVIHSSSRVWVWGRVQEWGAPRSVGW